MLKDQNDLFKNKLFGVFHPILLHNLWNSVFNLFFQFILDRSQAREQGLATMLFCVVAVFFICNLLALVVNILEVRA